MTGLRDVAAAGHPDGNRIDVSWAVTAPRSIRVRVVRRTRTHPTTPNPRVPADGTVVAAGSEIVDGRAVVVDAGLAGDIV